MSKKKSKVEQLPQKFHQLFDALSKQQEFIGRMAFAALSDAEKTRAKTILDFKKAAFERAKVLGPEVWKNWDFVKDVFFWSPVEPSEVVLAALSYPKARTQAIGRSLLQRAARYTLLTSFRAMELNPEQLDKVLKHELVHMGYSGHGKDFIAVCREVGGTVGSAAVTGGEEGSYFEQRQPNGRYKRVSALFPTQAAAMTWFEEQRAARREQAIAWLAANPGKNMNDVTKALMWRMVTS